MSRIDSLDKSTSASRVVNTINVTADDVKCAKNNDRLLRILKLFGIGCDNFNRKKDNI